VPATPQKGRRFATAARTKRGGCKLRHRAVASAAPTRPQGSLANAIVIAQRAGETDEEIAHVTGYTVPMIRAVLRSS
jgi:hypothetical protein